MNIPADAQTTTLEIVTDSERLKELPPHTAVIDTSSKPEFDPGATYTRLTKPTNGYVWYNENTRQYHTSEEIRLPATVIYLPTKFREGAV